MSQAGQLLAVDMSNKVIITASQKAADLLFKAVKHAVIDGEYPEVINDFQRQNPATRRLVEEVDKAFDIMAISLLKQVEKILASESKATIESKTN